MPKNSQDKPYPVPGQATIRKRLDELRPVLASAVVGDFSKDLPIPEKEDIFTELFVGVQVMQEVIRDQLHTLQSLNQALAVTAAEKETALEEAQALTHLGSWQWDVANNVILWSDELYRMFGMAPQSHIVDFEEFLSYIHPDDRPRVQAAIQQAFKTCAPFEFEHRVTLPDGSERVLHGMGKVTVDKHGKPIRMFGTSQDITEAKRLDRAKDEFISLVSHQLRTPLTIIRLYGNMLSDGIAGPLDRTQLTYVRKITGASVRLIKLVGDILNISRLELNRIKVEARPCNVNDLIATYTEELAPLAQSKGIQVHFKPQADVGKVKLDPTIFGEITHSLVSNALRYATGKGGQVTISFRRQARGYLLTVRDNGIGIPPASQAHIFERFYRASNAANADGEGTGLGLYLVKLFTDTTGGKVWFKSNTSETEHGTTFYVLLPLEGMRSSKTSIRSLVTV